MNGEPNKIKKGCGGCFTLIIFLIIIFKIISHENGPDIINKTIDSDGLSYKENQYTIKSIGDKDVIFTDYKWDFVTTKLKRKSINLNIEVSRNEVEIAMDQLETLYYLTDEELKLTYNYDTNPVEFSNELWSQIYKRLVEKTGHQVDSIADNIEKIALNEKLNRNDMLILCITMVQNIEYKIPTEMLGIIPPIVSIARENGDCDTVSILLFSILERLGYDTIMYYSNVYSHAMLGVNTNGTGFYKTYNGIPYYFLELTNPGWGIGQISPEMQDLNNWYPIVL